ncbi:MAG: short-chain dehydrogenase/reductase [Leeuwenhoekiella sp.]|uniref:oxidoreductase n=1 Tax=Marinobacter sp. NP-4(2019) TaxID=2488665 RepID=UPI000C1020A1|nr:oxidoreductase [Marinobacter sp. NP-4(2019)]AZT83969.1 SDR family NAD(P)-dependent oxidoreductase [Marinobacter sp. NP-4(2019)]PHS02162.1 MAG: short-chain dehydrogenase/reductase [Leeuwenhoekiella sp.]
MNTLSQKVWLITGASSGFGKALAEAVIANGDVAVITARRLDRLQTIAQGHEDQVLPLEVDVTDAAARDTAVADTIARFGRIDVLANVAGRGVAGACEEFSLDQLREQMELNFFAAAELTRAVLPQMRKQGSGNILTVSSIAGLVAMNAAGPYCAAKFAIEGWTESLAIEAKPLGINVTLVEPGAFRTEFAGDVNMRPLQSIAAYRPMVEPFETYLETSAGKQIGDPSKAAQRMLEVVASDQPPVRLMLGRDAYSIWGTTIAKRQEDLESWRAQGEDTAFDDAEFKEIEL